MPFRQLVPTIIDANSVRSGAFSFRVESSLALEQPHGKLVINASAGYLLTSSDGKAPRQQVTLDYVQQPDGSRVAHDTLMLLPGTDSLTEGTVTLRDPAGETLILPVVTGAAAEGLRQQPLLTVGAPALHLDKTRVGDETFSILNISQRFADTPVSVVVDDPTQFSVATGVKQLLFGPSLLFTPAPTGTYIHVRYQPDRPGRHVAKLYVETPYETKTVRLTGRTIGILPPVIGRQPTDRTDQRDQLLLPAPSEMQRPLGRLRLPALLLLGGLAYGGYTYRCELAPSLCRQSAAVGVPQPAVVTPSQELPPDRSVATESELSVDEPSSKSFKQSVRGADKLRLTEETETPRTRREERRTERERPAETESAPALVARTRPQTDPEQPKAEGSRRSAAPAEVAPAPKRRSNQTSPAADESDLEQELNKKPGG